MWQAQAAKPALPKYSVLIRRMNFTHGETRSISGIPGRGSRSDRSDRLDGVAGVLLSERITSHSSIPSFSEGRSRVSALHDTPRLSSARSQCLFLTTSHPSVTSRNLVIIKAFSYTNLNPPVLSIRPSGSISFLKSFAFLAFSAPYILSVLASALA